tara:strand:- start:26 stop:1162 length:1137 start_codon:yes stop_codon:yes gene_type:complete
LKTNNAILLFENGTEFHGQSIGIDGIKSGEVVFNTSMTGYQEILTDPSYHSQIINFTNPHIGNTGINDLDLESNQIHVSGMIIRDSEIQASNWRKTSTLSEYLVRNKVIGMSGVDTREITRLLRDRGSLNACMMCNKNLSLDDMKSELNKFPGLVGQDLAKLVSTDKTYDWNEGSVDLYGKRLYQPNDKFKVIAYDFGIKQNILRILRDLGCNIKVVPATFPAKDVFEYNPDGIFLSNGPGDPEACHYAIKNIKEILKHKIPMFGICLGFQLLGISVGGKAIKMKFGHHGANHPVINLNTKKVLITSQNHGFMIDEKTLPPNVYLTHRSLFDDSLQGIELPDYYAYGFQGHPEASPGPHDIHHIFNKFISFMTEKKNA